MYLKRTSSIEVSPRVAISGMRHISLDFNKFAWSGPQLIETLKQNYLISIWLSEGMQYFKRNSTIGAKK